MHGDESESVLMQPCDSIPQSETSNEEQEQAASRQASHGDGEVGSLLAPKIDTFFARAALSSTSLPQSALENIAPNILTHFTVKKNEQYRLFANNYILITPKWLTARQHLSSLRQLCSV